MKKALASVIEEFNAFFDKPEKDGGNEIFRDEEN